MQTSYETLDIQRSNQVLTVWLNRPEKHNAFNDQMIGELTTCFTEVGKEKGIRLVVLRGKGKTFCAGADLNYMKSIAAFGHDENYRDARALANLFETIYKCRVPTMAVVQGAAFGGANGLLAACDIVVAGEQTTFAFSEVKIGIAAATIGPFVLRRTGEFKGKEWMMTGKRFKAPEAAKGGLVNTVVPDEEIDATVNTYIKEFQSAAPCAVRYTKEMINFITGEAASDITAYTADLIARLRASEEGQEGMAAFLEKRKPGWVEE
jgi:methylglutaconyl-CoA hydratase